MELLLKMSAALLLTVVLLLILERQNKHIAVMLCIVVCCMIATATAHLIDPIIALIHRLQQIAQIDGDVIESLFKSTVGAILCEVTAMVCSEAGYSSLGKTLQFAGIGVIMYFSIPLFDTLLDMITQLLGGI